MTLVRLEAVARPPQRRDSPGDRRELGRGLLPGCQQRVRLAPIRLAGLVGPPALVRVLYRQTQRRHRPRARTTTRPAPAQPVPAQTPARPPAGPGGCGAAGAPPTRARGLRTAPQAVAHLRRPLHRPELMIAVVAHGQAACTAWARTLRAIPITPFPYGPRRPTLRHGRSILVRQAVKVEHHRPTIASSRPSGEKRF